MPTDAVWVIITVPRKEYEKQLKRFKRQNNLNIADEINERENDSQIYLEKVLADTLEELQIEDVVWVATRNGNYYQVYFPCELFENDSVLNILKSKGIGTKSETSVGYIPFNLFFYEELSGSEDDTTDDLIIYNNYCLPEDNNNRKFNINNNNNNKKALKDGFKEVTQNFLKSVTSRLTVAQVVEGVKSGSEVTFDFCVYTLMAGFIAAFGLINNDPVNIAASMMIEPIMGTVMAMTFGLVIEDRKLLMLGIKSNIISLIICLVSGFCMGLIMFIWMTEWHPPPSGIWPTNEMQVRGTYRGLIYGVMIALPCGGAIAVTLLNENHAALVGVAVASTFLPPFINTGLLWALSVHLQIKGLKQHTVPYNISGHVFNTKPAWAPQAGYLPVYSYDMRIENALLGCVSMALTALNIICMLVVAYITLKIKEVVPLQKMAPGTQRFFKHDIKIARQYNRKSLALGREQPLGQQILNEWADISGIDKNQLLDETPEARVTRLQTLCDIAEDVEADQTYQHVMKHAMGNPDHNSGLLRRLTQPVLFDINKKDEPSTDTVWSIEKDLSRTLNGRRYSIRPVEKVKDPDDSNNSSSYSTIGKGLKPSELMAARGRRRSSNLLRKSLKNTTHSPYSIWPGTATVPSNQHSTRSNSLGDPLRVRRRTLFAPNLESHSESTGF